jgi:hypothetical protein
MTEQQEEEHVPAEAPDVITPVPVHIPHQVDVQAQAADFGAYMTYVTPAGADQARPVLPFDGNRHAARIIVSSLVNPVVGTPGIWVGTQAQCQASPPVGGFLPVGSTLLVEHNQPVWMIGDGTTSLRVTVAIERWDSGTGQ